MFSNLSIRIKILSIVFGGVVGLMVVQAYNYMVATHNKVLLEDVRDIYFPVLERLDSNTVRFEKIKDSYSAAVISGDEDVLEDIVKLSKKLEQVLNEIVVLDNKDKLLVEEILENFSHYTRLATPLSIKIIDETIDMEQAQPQIKEMNEIQDLISRELKSFRDQSYQSFNKAINTANKKSEDAIYAELAIGFFTVFALVCFGLYVSQSITRNIATVNSSLKEMANGDGDLTTRLKSNSCDEIGVLVENFNNFVSKLQGVIIDVSGSTGRLTEAANETKRVSQASVLGMEAQQLEINQVIAAMAEMTGSVTSVSNSASQAVNVAHMTSSEASDGKQVVEENMQTIERLANEVEHAADVIEKLESDSESIAKVLSVIRGIAEQTNLLALNAAIEAARAGEQGRGFAVVADEVRTLATRTHDATEEINSMISRLQTGTQNAVNTMMQSREQANASVTQAARVGESLERITQGIIEINDMNDKIANAAEEQANVSQEINNNIVNLGQVVNQVADGARDADENSSKLLILADQLKGQVSSFKV